MLHGVGHLPTRQALQAVHPGLVAAGQQLLEDYNFDGIELVLPTTLFDTRYELDLDGTEAHLIFVGPCHQAGDTIVHVPGEGVVFAGDENQLRALIAKVEDATLKSGKALGTVAPTGPLVKQLFARGYTFLISGSDLTHLRAGIAQMMKEAGRG